MSINSDSEKSNMFDFSGKNIFVIGGSSGLGLEIAKAFTLNGANVAIGGRSESNFKKAEKCFTASNLALPKKISVDVGKINSLKKARSVFLKKYHSIDILVCTAGTHTKTPTLKMKYADWQKIIDVNLNGTYLADTIFGEKMVEQKKGVIINISSLGAKVALSGATAYNVSKSGVEMLTKCLASEWAEYNVRVNAILPGVFKTPLNEKALSEKKRAQNILRGTPMKRFGKLKEIASAAMFLASKDSSFVTGTSVVVDGGFLAFSGY